jgi:pre-mRNA-splicing factor SYF1
VWASLLENSGNLHEAERVFKQAVKINFKSVDEFASVWCGWAEMLLRLELFGHALEVMRQAVEEPQSSIRRKRERLTQGNSYINGDFDGPLASDKLYRNVKVWSLLLDLEESFGSIESCRAGYERVMDLKVITAQMVLNYASFLEEQHYYEDSFQVYEKAISLFEYPQLKSIWLAYLDKFADRYNGLKLERLRDLYEQAVAKVPPADAAEFFIKYAHIEEQYGLARHVVAIYDRATKAVLENHKLDMFRLYIKKVEILFGIVKTRPVYERALKELSDDSCKRLCIEYAEMERKLGEIDRARSIFVYGSQFADPKRDINYWKSWQDFEETFGNEETFREMLRIQRSVEVTFSHVNYVADLVATQVISKFNLPVAPEEKVVDRNALKRKFVTGDSAILTSADGESKNKHARNEEEIDI